MLGRQQLLVALGTIQLTSRFGATSLRIQPFLALTRRRSLASNTKMAFVASSNSDTSAEKRKADEDAVAEYAAVFSLASSPSQGWVFGDKSSRTDILLSQSVRDLEGNKVRSFVSSYRLADGSKGTLHTEQGAVLEQTSIFPMELQGAVIFSPSPSGRRLAIMKEAADSSGDKAGGAGAAKSYVIELWSREPGSEGLIARVPTSKTHSKVMSGSWFGGFSWAKDESWAVYVAEKPAPKTRSFFSEAPPSTAQTSPEDEAKPGSQFSFREDWGEQYEGVVDLGLYIVHFVKQTVTQIPGLPSSLTPGQPQVVPVPGSDGEEQHEVVYVGWDTNPRRLGMIYCYQRPCKLYCVDVTMLLQDAKKEEKEMEGLTDDQKKEKKAEKEKEEKEKHRCLTEDYRLSRSPRFSPSGEQMVFLSRKEGFETHSGSFRLCIAPWTSGAAALDVKTLVDIVQVPALMQETDAKAETGTAAAAGGVGGGSAMGFPGLWMDDLPTSCWADDEKAVYCSTSWGSVESVVKVDVTSGAVERLTCAMNAIEQDPATGPPSAVSVSVLSVGAGGVLVAASSPNQTGGFAFISSSAGTSGPIVHRGPSLGRMAITSGIKVPQSVTDSVAARVKGMKWRVLSLMPDPPATGSTGKQERPFEAVLMLPPAPSPPSSDVPPLVVIPHGGPHGVVPTSFMPSYAYLCAVRGYAVVRVNYRGSTGFGTSALESLPGKIGQQDVADMVQATKAVLSLSPPVADAKRVAVVGGSHGGFLAGHLSGQYPDLFKVAVLINPVTNIASMVTVSDIPDWCHIEALGLGSYEWDSFNAPTAEQLSAMYQVSPVAHINQVRAPTLVTIGAKDRRVPHSQGLEWYHALKSKGVPSKLLLYPEDVHAIDKPASDADLWQNTVIWLKEHL